tara:strand:- start:826 stop:2217 length:1392 start_codon:yes stop_codon:yes gene_type:complete
MKMTNWITKIKPHLYFFILAFFYFGFFFFNTQPFWGLMDDATSIKTAIQFSEKPITTTIEWVEHHNKNGMFRPFFALQQFIQFTFYDFNNPFPTFLFNIFTVLLGVYLFSKNFIEKTNLIIFYSLFLMWPYTYDWLFLPSLNSKWGLILFGIALLLKKGLINNSLKFLLGLFSVLMKLNVIILLPLGFYAEKNREEKLYISSGMFFGLVIQLVFFFSYPNSYYNTGILETIKTGNLLTIQNIIIGFILLIMFLDLRYLRNNKNEKLLILSSLGSIFISLGILNLRNSSYAYLGALLFFPIAIYLVSLISKLKKNLNFDSDKLSILVIIICLVISNTFLLNPRLERWNDLDNLVSNNFQSKAVYFCEEGQKMINIWDIEKNNPEFSYFIKFPDIYENIYLWIETYNQYFRFIEFENSTQNEFDILYVIDPFCEKSVDYFNSEISTCNHEYIYNNQIKLVKKLNC